MGLQEEKTPQEKRKEELYRIFDSGGCVGGLYIQPKDQELLIERIEELYDIDTIIKERDQWRTIAEKHQTKG